MQMTDFHVVTGNGENILYHVPTSTIICITDELAVQIKEGVMSKKTLKNLLNLLADEKEFKIPEYKINEGPRLGNLVFLTTEKCNLRCKYCYQNGSTHYHSNTESGFALKDYLNTLQFILKKYPMGVDNIKFFGGEPLLEIKIIKEFVENCTKRFSEMRLKLPKFSIMTNATLFTEEIIGFFNEYNFGVGISIDGPKAINDLARVSAEGFSVFDRVKESLKMMKGKRNFIVGIEATVHRGHILNYKEGDARKWLEELIELGVDDVMFVPVESDNLGLMLDESMKETYQSICKEMVDFWFEELIKDDCKLVSWNIINMINGITSKKFIEDCSAGRNSLLATSRGDIYPCQLFYDSKGYRMGSINSNSEENFELTDEIKKVSNVIRLETEECKKCHVRNLCEAWCKGINYSVTGNILATLQPRCWMTKANFDGVISNLVSLKNQPEKYKTFVTNIKSIILKYAKTNIM